MHYSIMDHHTYLHISCTTTRCSSHTNSSSSSSSSRCRTTSTTEPCVLLTHIHTHTHCIRQASAAKHSELPHSLRYAAQVLLHVSAQRECFVEYQSGDKNSSCQRCVASKKLCKLSSMVLLALALNSPALPALVRMRVITLALRSMLPRSATHPQMIHTK
jgi:hypothetical protein